MSNRYSPTTGVGGWGDGAAPQDGGLWCSGTRGDDEPRVRVGQPAHVVAGTGMRRCTVTSKRLPIRPNASGGELWVVLLPLIASAWSAACTTALIGTSDKTVRRLQKRRFFKSIRALRAKQIPRSEIDRYKRETL